MAEVRRIGVVGAGAMGSGIAQVAAQAGYEVVLQDVELARVEHAVARMDTLLQRAVQKGRLSEAECQQILARLTPSADLQDLAGVDFVVEAIYEEPQAKKALFADLDRICRPDVVLASNTSSISITDIAGATQRPELVCGMHFFNPVPVMKLVEVVRGHFSAEATISLACQIGEAMGKTVIEVKKDTPGFVVNRILMPFMVEAARVVEEGIASVDDVDKAIKMGLNHPMGPFELMDFTGIDICYNVMDYFWSEFRDARYAPPHLIKNMVRSGRIGKKVGKGFYNHK